MENNTNKELLQQVALTGLITESGEIDMAVVREMAESMNRIKLDKMYEEAKSERKVWKGEGKDQRWKFKREDGSIVAKTTEEAIKETYIDYISTKTLEDRRKTATFADLYSYWLEHVHEMIGTKESLLSPSTYRRYQLDYDRYIKGTTFSQTLIKDITPITIEKFLITIVKKHNLIRRCYTNIVGYLRATFLYARKSGLLDKNPMELVDVKTIKGHCRVNKIKNSEQIISIPDMQNLIETLHDKQASNELYVQNYAIELATMTGMRVGELAALKWDNINDTYINIELSEHRLDYDDKPCEYIIAGTKNDKERQFPLSPEIKNLLNRVKDIQDKNGIKSEFVFANKEGRVNSHTITCAMSRRCKDAGIEEKCIHDIRRTVSSHLRTVLPVATVANMLGHLPETNDKHYNYDVTPDKITADCLKGMYQTFQKVA